MYRRSYYKKRRELVAGAQYCGSHWIKEGEQKMKNKYFDRIYKVSKLCASKNLYTRGSADQFSSLCYLISHGARPYDISMDIIRHSNDMPSTEIDTIMQEIIDICA
jgi:hypothetical protein